MRYIINENTKIAKQIEYIYEYVCLEHVINIESKFNQWIVDVEPHNSVKIPILIIDTTSHAAFCHWVFESAIYLPFFLILKKKYPKLKLHLTEYKTYKTLFCDYFQIQSSDIIYELEPNNICIFPLPVSSLNINRLDRRWKNHFDYFIAQLSSLLGDMDGEKTISTIFLPRQTKENYKANDRTYNTVDISEHLMGETDYILHTDTITELKTQMELVNSSKNMIVTGGSPYLVNGLFSRNSSIIVLDNLIQYQMREFSKMKYVHDEICKHNHVVFIPNRNNNTFYYNDIVNELI